jgi:hypothetical protein
VSGFIYIDILCICIIYVLEDLQLEGRRDLADLSELASGDPSADVSGFIYIDILCIYIIYVYYICILLCRTIYFTCIDIYMYVSMYM